MIFGVLGGLLGLLATGMPIFVVLGTIAVVLFWMQGVPLIGVSQVVVDRLNSGALIAIPLFVVAATFMQRGGIAKALIDFASALVGSVRGGLGLVCVVATTVFAAISGSSVATAMAMGTLLVPAMIAHQYERKFAVGVVGASGTLGILVPPSLVLIIFAIIAEESVPRLFLAGVIPGLMQAVLFAGYILWYAKRNNYPRAERLPPSAAIRATFRALPALSIPIIVFVGIYGGIVTVAEAAALSAIVAIFASLFAYREITVRDILPVLAESMRAAGAIIVIIVGALLFGHWITESGIPARIVEFAISLDLKAWQFLLFINIMMLVLGMFLEGIAVTLIVLPLVLPLLGPLDISPIHFAIVLTINIELALLTPPVGLNLYVLQSISRTPIGEVIRGTWPFIALLFILLMLVTYVPIISTWLPSFVFDG